VEEENPRRRDRNRQRPESEGGHKTLGERSGGTEDVKHRADGATKEEDTAQTVTGRAGPSVPLFLLYDRHRQADGLGGSGGAYRRTKHRGGRGGSPCRGCSRGCAPHPAVPTRFWF